MAVLTLAEYAARRLPWHGSQLRVGEPLGGDRRTTLLRHRIQMGRIKVTAVHSSAPAVRVRVGPTRWGPDPNNSPWGNPDYNASRLECADGTWLSDVRVEFDEERSASSGRPNFAQLDAPLVAEMRQMLRDDNTKNPWNAALRLAPRAEGTGTLESKAKRLLTRFRKSR